MAHLVMHKCNTPQLQDGWHKYGSDESLAVSPCIGGLYMLQTCPILAVLTGHRKARVECRRWTDKLNPWTQVCPTVDFVRFSPWHPLAKDPSAL